jgi:hypothetical protein
MTESKQAFLNAAITAGYKLTNKPPKFQTIKFSPSSEEAKLALSNKVAFQFTQPSFIDAETELSDDLLYHES